MRLQRRAVIGLLVAEQRAERVQAAGIGHEAIPVIVPDLVAQVPEQGPIWLAQHAAASLALGVVRLGQADGDQAGIMAGHHLRRVGGGADQVAHEVEGQPLGRIFALGRHRQAELQERVEQPVLGRLELLPAREIAVATGPGPCGCAGRRYRMVGRLGSDQPVAGTVRALAQGDRSTGIWPAGAASPSGSGR